MAEIELNVKTMRAVVCDRQAPIGGQPLGVRDLPVPDPGPGELLLRVAACGVCRTDLHIVEGDLPPARLPVIPGHQIVGEVCATGDGAHRYSEGDPVGVAWLHQTCGECGFCREERENLCRDATFTGYSADGGYAEYVAVPENFAYPLPEGFSPEQAAPLLCAGIIGYRAFRLSGVPPGGHLGLFGFGGSAHVTIQVARHLGCRISVFSRSENHLALARRLGASWTGQPDRPCEQLLDGAIVFAPVGDLVVRALRSLERGGTVAVAGIHMTDIPSVQYRWLYQERCIRSVANYTRQDVMELLGYASRIPIRTEVCCYPLADANRALADLAASRIDGAAVLMCQ